MEKTKKVVIWFLIFSLFFGNIQWPIINVKADIIKDLSLGNFEADAEYPFLMIILNKKNNINNFYAVKSSVEIQYMSEYNLVVSEKSANIKYYKYENFGWNECNDFISKDENNFNKKVLFVNEDDSENSFIEVVSNNNVNNNYINNLGDGFYVIGYTGLNTTDKLTNHNFLSYTAVEETKVNNALLAKEIVKPENIQIAISNTTSGSTPDFTNILAGDIYTIAGFTVNQDDISWSPTNINWNIDLIQTSDNIQKNGENIELVPTPTNHSINEFVTLDSSNGKLTFKNSFPCSAIIKLTGNVSELSSDNTFIFYMYINGNSVVNGVSYENKTIENNPKTETGNIYNENNNTTNLDGSTTKNNINNSNKAEDADLIDEGGMDQGSANNETKNSSNTNQTNISDTARKAYNAAITNTPKQNALKNKENTSNENVVSYNETNSVNNLVNIDDTVLKELFEKYKESYLTGGFKGLNNVSYTEQSNSSKLTVKKNAKLGIKKGYNNTYKLYSSIFYPVYQVGNKDKKQVSNWNITSLDSQEISLFEGNITDYIKIENNQLIINQENIAKYRKEKRNVNLFKTFEMKAEDSENNDLNFNITVEIDVENDYQGYVPEKQILDTGIIVYSIKNNSTGQYGTLPERLKHLDKDTTYHSLINYGEYQLLFFTTEKPVLKTFGDKDFRLNLNNQTNIEIWKNVDSEWKFFNYFEKLEEGYISLPASGEKSIEYVNYILLNESNQIILQPNTVDNAGNIKIRQTKIPTKYINGGNNSIFSNADGYKYYYLMLSNNIEYFIYKTKNPIEFNGQLVKYPNDFKTYNLVQNTWILCDDNAKTTNKYIFTNKDDFNLRLIYSNDNRKGVSEITNDETGAIDYFKYIPYYGARSGYHYIISDSGDNFNAIEYSGATAIIKDGRVKLAPTNGWENIDVKQKKYANLTWIDVTKDGSTTIKDKNDILDKNSFCVKLDSFAGSLIYSDVDINEENTSQTVFKNDFANSMIVTKEMGNVDFNCKQPSLSSVENFPGDLDIKTFSDNEGNLTNYFLIEENGKYIFYAFPKNEKGTMYWNSSLGTDKIEKNIYLQDINKENFTGISCIYDESNAVWKFDKKIVTPDYKLTEYDKESNLLKILDKNEDDGFYYLINHSKVSWFGITIYDVNTSSGIMLSRDDTKKFYGSMSIGTTTYEPENGSSFTIIDGSTIANDVDYIQPIDNKDFYYIELIDPLNGVYDPLTQYDFETEQEFNSRKGYGQVLTTQTESIQLYIPMFNTAIRSVVGTVMGDGKTFDLNGLTSLLRQGSWYEEKETYDELAPDIDIAYAVSGKLKIKATDNPEPQPAVVNEVIETGQPSKDVIYYFVGEYKENDKILTDVLWEKIPKENYDYLIGSSGSSGNIADFGNLENLIGQKYAQQLNKDILNLYNQAEKYSDDGLIKEDDSDMLLDGIDKLEESGEFSVSLINLNQIINNLQNNTVKEKLNELKDILIRNKNNAYNEILTELKKLHDESKLIGTLYTQIEVSINKIKEDITDESLNECLDIITNNENVSVSDLTKLLSKNGNYYRSLNVKKNENGELETDKNYYINNNYVYFGGNIAPRRIIQGINTSTGEDIAIYYTASGLKNIYIVVNTAITTENEVNIVNIETGETTKKPKGTKLESGTIIQLDSSKTIDLLPYGTYGIFATDKTGNKGIGEFKIIDGKRELISGKENKEITIELNSDKYDNIIHYPKDLEDQQKVNGYEDIAKEIEDAIANSKFDTASPDILYAYIYKRNLIVVAKDKSQSIEVPVAGFSKGEWNVYFNYTDFANKENQLIEDITFLDKASNTKTLKAGDCYLKDIVNGTVIGYPKPFNFYKNQFEFGLIKDETKKIEEGTLNFTIRDKNNNQTSTTRDIAVSEENNNTVVYGTCDDEYILKMLEKAREEEQEGLDAWPVIKSIYTLNGILYIEATDDKGIEEYGYQFRYSTTMKADTTAKKYTYVNSQGEIITELNKKLNKGTSIPAKSTIYKNEYYQPITVPNVMTIYVSDNYKDEEGNFLHTISRQITVTNENEIIYGEVSDEIKDAIDNNGGDTNPDKNEGPQFTAVYTYQGYLYIEGYSKAGLHSYAYGYQPNENMIIPSNFSGINDEGEMINIDANTIIQSGTKIYKNNNYQKIQIPVHIRVWLKDINNKTNYLDLFVDKDNYSYFGKVPPDKDGEIDDGKGDNGGDDGDDDDNKNEGGGSGGIDGGPIEPGDDDNIDGDKVKPDDSFDDIDWDEYDYVFELLDYDSEEVVYRIRKDKAETIQLPKLEDSAHYLYYEKAVSEIDNVIYKTIYGDFYMEDETPPIITKITYSNNRIYVSAYDAGGLAKKPYSFSVEGSRSANTQKYQESNNIRVISGDVINVSVKDDEGNIITVQVTIKDKNNSILYECVNPKKPLSVENGITKTVSYWITYLKDEYDIDIKNLKLADKNNTEQIELNTQGTTVTFNFEGYGTLSFYDEIENKYISLALRTSNAGKSYRSIIVELGSETNFELVFKKKLIETFGSLNGITWAVDTDYLDRNEEDMIEANHEGIGRVVAKKNGVKETFYIVVAKKISKVTSNTNFAKENFAYTYLVGNKYKLSKALSIKEDDDDEDNDKKKKTAKTKKDETLYVVIDKHSDGIKITTDDEDKEYFKVNKKGIQTITLLDVVNDKIFEAKFEAVAVIPHISQFSDIIGSDARSDIEYLSERGVIVNYPDERFKPNNKMTTKEFLTMLNRVRLTYSDDFEIEKQTKTIKLSEKDFDYYASMNILINLNQSEVDNILGTYSLNKAITLNEVVELISATLLQDDYHNESGYTTPSGLSDVSESALHLLSMGIIKEDDTRNGTREVTRAEVSYMLTQTVKYLES